MLSNSVKYLKAKLAAANLIHSVYGLGEIKTVDGERFPAVYEKGDLIHADFDTKTSMSFFLLDGKVSRETEESQMIAGLYNVKEAIPMKLILYVQGSEDINCESKSQDIAWGVSKTLTGKQLSFMSELSLDFSSIEVKETDLDGESVWESLYSTETRLKDSDILIAISFTFNVEGFESCFVNDICTARDLDWSFSALSFCEKVADCVEQKHKFLTTSAQTYLFDGTVTAWNPSGIDLRGCEITNLFVGGLEWNDLLTTPEWNLNATTGLLTLVKDVIADDLCSFSYKTI